MTGIAADVGMSAGQWKSCLRVMVELPGQPVHGVMTGRTVLREPVVVRVILSVAIDALLGRIAEHMCGMAIVALNVRVLAE